MNEYLQLMKSELMVVIIIFILLFIKLGKGLSNSTLLSLVQLLLLLNVGISFGFNETGRIFSGMFVHNELVGFQKGILALAVYLISLLCSDWLKEHEHMPEFFMLMLSALLGMFFLVSSDHLLMFYISLELASIPVAPWPASASPSAGLRRASPTPSSRSPRPPPQQRATPPCC